MKKINRFFTLTLPAAAIAGVMMLAGCTADELQPSGGTSLTPPTGGGGPYGTVEFTNNTSMTIGDAGSLLASTRAFAPLTRAAGGTFTGNLTDACTLDIEESERPTEEALAASDQQQDDHVVGEVTGRDLLIKSGVTCELNGTLETMHTISRDVYVQGTLNVNGICKGGGRIVVLQGGTLNYNTDSINSINILVLNGGNLNVNTPTGKIGISRDASLKIESADLALADNIMNVGGKLYVGGDLSCAKIVTANDGAQIHVTGNLSTFDKNESDLVNDNVNNNVTIDNESDLCVEGSMIVDNLIASGNADIHVGCKLVSTDRYKRLGYQDIGLNLTRTVTLSAPYIDVSRFSAAGNITVNLIDGGIIEVYHLAFSPTGNGAAPHVNISNDGIALLYMPDPEDGNLTRLTYSLGGLNFNDVFGQKMYLTYGNNLYADGGGSSQPTAGELPVEPMINVATVNSGEYACNPGFTVTEPEPEDPDNPDQPVIDTDDIVIPIPSIDDEYSLKADDFAIRVNGDYIEDIDVNGNTASLIDIKITEHGLEIVVSGLVVNPEILEGNDYTYEVWLWVDNRKLDTENGTGKYVPLFDTEGYCNWIGKDVSGIPFDYDSPAYEPGVDITESLKGKVKSPAGYVVRYNVYRGLSGHIDKSTGLGDTPYIKVSVSVQKDPDARENTNVGIWPAAYNN